MAKLIAALCLHRNGAASAMRLRARRKKKSCAIFLAKFCHLIASASMTVFLILADTRSWRCSFSAAFMRLWALICPCVHSLIHRLLRNWLRNSALSRKSSYPQRLSLALNACRFLFRNSGCGLLISLKEAARNTTSLKRWRLRGDLDINALRSAVNEIIERHESLRTCFAQIDGDPVQIICPHLALDVPFIDLSALDPHKQQEELNNALHNEWEEPFDLTRGPLLRAKLIRLSAQEHIFLRTFHHVVADGWSEEIFNREFAELYAAFCEGRRPALPPLPLQYADYVLWQHSAAGEPRRSAALDYWTRQLLEAPDQLDLPRDRPRPARQSFSGALLHVTIPEGQLSSLKDLARSNDCTLYMALVAAFSRAAASLQRAKRYSHRLSGRQSA